MEEWYGGYELHDEDYEEMLELFELLAEEEGADG